MPEIPPEAVTAAVNEIMRQRGLTADHCRAWAEPIARAALDGAAPVLAEAVAQKITGHMEAHGPQAGTPPIGGQSRRAWRRHFQIAARIAAFAFATEDDKKQAAIEAIARGDAAICLDSHEETVTCRGFQWIGQSFAFCDGCGKPAWEHEGEMRLREGASLFSGSEDWELRPWRPGEAEAIKRKWGPR